MENNGFLNGLLKRVVKTVASELLDAFEERLTGKTINPSDKEMNYAIAVYSYKKAKEKKHEDFTGSIPLSKLPLFIGVTIAESLNTRMFERQEIYFRQSLEASVNFTYNPVNKANYTFVKIDMSIYKRGSKTPEMASYSIEREKVEEFLSLHIKEAYSSQNVAKMELKSFLWSLEIQFDYES